MSDKIQLYSLATPNGQKVSVALEEMGIEYDAHTINIMKDDQFTPDFIKINPNSKIPAIVDPVGDNGNPLSIMESGAILIYLAEKSGMFLPSSPVERSKTLQWLFFQVGGAGPMFGQFGHFFKYAGSKITEPYPLERYSKEAKRLLQVIDIQLSANEFIAGNELTIADFSLAPWVVCLDKFYEAGDQLGLSGYKNINRWAESFLERPKVQEGMTICSDF